MKIYLHDWSVERNGKSVMVNMPMLNGVDMSKSYRIKEHENETDAFARAVADRIMAFSRAMSYRWYAGQKNGN